MYVSGNGNAYEVMVLRIIQPHSSFCWLAACLCVSPSLPSVHSLVLPPSADPCPPLPPLSKLLFLFLFVFLSLSLSSLSLYRSRSLFSLSSLALSSLSSLTLSILSLLSRALSLSLSLLPLPPPPLSPILSILNVSYSMDAVLPRATSLLLISAFPLTFYCIIKSLL